ncbi:basic salivary proline-rich protein 4-like [Orycteropus afer afer]|uniref:Basic salivary proline-rich protein 4-like n=1 Tax=Orycteropus afer afer TaxID=1230840 RepID=A0A8B7B246_ORYAF|nr:basic salivary proline-rich protein 4-like [Orycteropus afer afer]
MSGSGCRVARRELEGGSVPATGSSWGGLPMGDSEALGRHVDGIPAPPASHRPFACGCHISRLHLHVDRPPCRGEGEREARANTPRPRGSPGPEQVQNLGQGSGGFPAQGSSVGSTPQEGGGPLEVVQHDWEARAGLAGRLELRPRPKYSLGTGALAHCKLLPHSCPCGSSRTEVLLRPPPRIFLPSCGETGQPAKLLPGPTSGATSRLQMEKLRQHLGIRPEAAWAGGSGRGKTWTQSQRSPLCPPRYLLSSLSKGYMPPEKPTWWAFLWDLGLGQALWGPSVNEPPPPGGQCERASHPQGPSVNEPPPPGAQCERAPTPRGVNEPSPPGPSVNEPPPPGAQCERAPHPQDL